VTFFHGPLAVHSGGRPISFELCTGVRACRFADAAAQGEDVLIADANSADAYVRYCWGDSPICNLYNEADLPASPFELIIE
jgi:sialate O-acetylesterase